MPEIAIGLEEGEQLAASINVVAKEYNLTFDSKTTALVGLVLTAGSIYIPRIGAAIVRLKQERLNRLQRMEVREQREPIFTPSENGDKRPANPGLSTPTEGF